MPADLKRPSSMLARLAKSLADAASARCVHVGSAIELRRDSRLLARLWLYHNASGATAIFEPFDPALRVIAGNRVSTFNRAMREHYPAAGDE